MLCKCGVIPEGQLSPEHVRNVGTAAYNASEFPINKGLNASWFLQNSLKRLFSRMDLAGTGRIGAQQIIGLLGAGAGVSEKN